MTKLLISPSILSADFAYMGDAMKNLEKWGADWAHVDVMDGMFVPNITFGMPMVKALRQHSNMVLDVHLMITRPERYIPRFIEAGADIITFHAETVENEAILLQTLDYVKSQGKKVGLTLNPDIDPSTIEKYLDKLDLVMLMGVFPGFGGQKFITEVLDKITMLKQMIGNRNILIELDGGVTLDNIGEMTKRGLDVAVAGSSVFCAKDPQQAVKAFQNIEVGK